MMTAEQREAAYKEIVETLRAHGVVQVCTPLRVTQYDKRHVDYFKVTSSGLYARNGKRWDCIDGVTLRFGRRVQK